MQRIKRSYVLWCAGLLLMAGGCGPSGSLVPVKGSVSVDGKPAGGVVLTFIKEGGGMTSIPATAATSEDGTFSLVTGAHGGAEPGKYKVNAVWPDPKASSGGKISSGDGNAFDVPDLLKGKYAFGKSTLTVEIKSGETQLAPIELKQ